MILEKEQTEEIVARLRAELDPTTIYLFGSQVRGMAAPGESDVDLFVVVPDDSEDCYSKSVRAYRSLRDLPFPKDILVRSESRFRERAKWSGAIEKEVLETGRKVFSR